MQIFCYLTNHPFVPHSYINIILHLLGAFPHTCQNDELDFVVGPLLQSIDCLCKMRKVKLLISVVRHNDSWIFLFLIYGAEMI